MDGVNSVSRSYGSKGVTQWGDRREAGGRKSSGNSSSWREEPKEVELKQEIERLQNVGQAEQSSGAKKQSVAGKTAQERLTDEHVPGKGAEAKTKAQNSNKPLCSQEQYAAWKSAQEWLERQKEAKEKKEKSYGLVSQLQTQADAWKKAMDPKRKKNLYDATMDLTLLEQIEKVPALKAMQSRLMFKIRSVKSSGAEESEIRRAVAKLKKVLGKVKGKVKGLQKEEQLEKKRKKAEEARRKTKEEAVRRELEMRKKIRKAKERKDIEESKMGLGANYGGPLGETTAVSYATDIHTSIEAAVSSDVGSAVDVEVAEMR